MNDYTIALIRTITNLILSAAITWLETKGVHVDNQTSAQLVVGLTGLNAACFFTIVHTLERYVSPRFGWLLGYAKKPNYALLKSETPTGK